MRMFFDNISCVWNDLIGYLDIHEGSITAAATSIIAAFTIALAISTKRLWKEAIRSSVIAEKSANAAEGAALAAKSTAQAAVHEFIASHRPKLILRDATAEQNMGELIVVNYIISNIGGTPATIIEGALRVKVFRGWEF